MNADARTDPNFVLTFPFTHAHRRAGILLEMVISMALFAGAAAMTLSAARDALGALERSAIEQQLIDVACSRMAELEAGIISLADLREDDGTAIGSAAGRSGRDELSGSSWVVHVQSERSEFRGLTLIELTVGEAPAGGADGIADDDSISFTLRQLVALAPQDDEGYEQDELLQGLPGAGETRP